MHTHPTSFPLPSLLPPLSWTLSTPPSLQIFPPSAWLLIVCVTDTFLKYQLEAEERYNENERREEVELEEKRRQDYQEHEMRMLGVLARMFQPSHRNYTGAYNFDNDFHADYYPTQ